jgi:membrane-associated phospholipid phosphatase
VCVAAGVGLTFAARSAVFWIPAALAFGITTARYWNRQKLSTAGLAWLIVTLGYACVWNGNYLLAATVEGRLHDATFVAIDSIVWGREYHDVFPLWTNHLVFVLLENSYVMLFPQVIVVLLVSAATQPREVVCRYVMVLFSAYAIGLTIFAVFPTVGPPIYFPASFKADWSGTFTAQLMKDMAAEFQQVQKGGGLNGFGYFVAFPSLHVAAAVILQRCMRNTPWLYWTWMPVTVLLILSTVVLGYHYLLDVPAGFILGYVLCRFLPRGVPVQATVALSAGRGGEVVD